jgi:hypothetical protein
VPVLRRCRAAAVVGQGNLAERVQRLARTREVDILVTEAVRTELDTRFVLAPMAA